MSAHTEGRLVLYTSNSWRRFCSDRGESICEPITQNDGHPDLWFRNGGAEGPDARRLVACWNACEGLPTRVLEVTHNLNDIYTDIQRERDELIEALRGVMGLVQLITHGTGEEYRTNHRYVHASRIVAKHSKAPA